MFIKYVQILIIPAYYKYYRTSCSFLPTVISIFIELDVLTRFQE